MQGNPAAVCFPVSFSRFKSSQCAIYTCDSSTTICESPEFSSRSSGHAIIPVLTPGFETSGHATENNSLSPTMSLKLPSYRLPRRVYGRNVAITIGQARISNERLFLPRLARCKTVRN